MTTRSENRSTVQWSIVIPAYNEESRLEPTVRTAVSYLRGRGESFEIMVVDDGSTDGTSALVRSIAETVPELRLIRLPANHGKGFAVRTGVLNAIGARVLFADADGATPISELERLEEALDDGADGAIGSRELREGGVSVNARFYRRVMGRTFHALVRMLAVRGYRDTQCGFKLFPRHVGHDLFSRMRMDGFSFDVELLLMAKLRGYTIREVSINWTHQPGSRINLVTDSLRMVFELFLIRSHLLRGRYNRPRLAQVEDPPAERAHVTPLS